MLQTGEGGDETTAIDAAAETAVVHRLEQLDEEFTLVSEELGERVFGSGRPWRVVCDPIDGSLNAKRDIPSSRSRSRSPRETMADVVFGYVYDFGSGEEDGRARPRRVPRRQAPRRGEAEGRDRDPLLRGDDDRRGRRRAAAMVGSAYRLRIMGSLALSLCHLAAGRVDAVCSLKPARSVDIAAGQLLVRECGLAIDLFEDPPFEAAPLDLIGRSRVVAAGTSELCRTLENALTA